KSRGSAKYPGNGVQERRNAHAKEGAAALEKRAHLEFVEQEPPVFVDQWSTAGPPLGFAAGGSEFLRAGRQGTAREAPQDGLEGAAAPWVGAIAARRNRALSQNDGAADGTEHNRVGLCGRANAAAGQYAGAIHARSGRPRTAGVCSVCRE